jgi:hypothetical protein
MDEQHHKYAALLTTGKIIVHVVFVISLVYFAWVTHFVLTSVGD